MRQSIHITVDIVVFYKKRQKTFILLIKRKNDPFKDSWAFPGGFVDNNELVINAGKRELKEETGLDLNIDAFQFLNYYDALDRDPRSRTVSFAFLAETDEQKDVEGNDDAQDAKWFPLEKLPKLAFDHSEILQDAINLIKT